MKTIRLVGTVDDQHQLSVHVPHDIPPGPVEIVVLLSHVEEDEAGRAWMEGIAHEWAAELSDPREDIYTLGDGEPVDDAR